MKPFLNIPAKSLLHPPGCAFAQLLSCPRLSAAAGFVLFMSWLFTHEFRAFMPCSVVAFLPLSSPGHQYFRAIGILWISFNFLFLKCYFTVVRTTYHEIHPLNTFFLSAQYRFVGCRDNVVQQIFRICSPCLTEMLCFSVNFKVFRFFFLIQKVFRF